MIRYHPLKHLLILDSKKPLRCDLKWGHEIKPGEDYYATDSGLIICAGCHDLAADEVVERERARRESCQS